jgi:hypothetical protein
MDHITTSTTLAETLNAGGKVTWPTGANAICITIGHKKAVVLKADVETLKGVGCGNGTVKFGRVKYDSESRPLRNTFVTVAANANQRSPSSGRRLATPVASPAGTGTTGWPDAEPAMRGAEET